MDFLENKHTIIFCKTGAETRKARIRLHRVGKKAVVKYMGHDFTDGVQKKNYASPIWVVLLPFNRIFLLLKSHIFSFFLNFLKLVMYQFFRSQEVRKSGQMDRNTHIWSNRDSILSICFMNYEHSNSSNTSIFYPFNDIILAFNVHLQNYSTLRYFIKT